MLKFKVIRIVFFTGLFALLTADVFYAVSGLLYAALILSYVALLAYGAWSLKSRFFLPAICSAKTALPQIAITFDDGPEPIVTLPLLDLLKRHGIKAGFFCIGKKIKGNEEIVKRMYHDGHVIGNHTYSHSTLIDFYNASAMKEELIKTEDAIGAVVNKKTVFFRPPYGITNPAISKAVSTAGYETIGWNIRSYDTLSKDPEKIFERIQQRLQPGAIILLHDNDLKIIQVVEKLIAYTQKNGITIVPLDQLLAINAYKNI
jgi:peptidoglycan/xylan/chitin deacetylase (PgdA/CDA1 family)